MTVCLAATAASLKGRIVREDTRKGISHATLTVEYADGIESYKADRKGKFSFNPKSFPITITVKVADMADATIGLISMPQKPIVIELPPTKGAPPAKRPDWSSAMRPRLSSTYIVTGKPAGN